jgi:hypothetical protein
MILALADNLGAESSDGTLAKELVVILLNVDLLLDFTDALGSDIASLLKTISNLEGVNSLIKEPLGLIEEGSGEHDDSGGSITDFVVLRLRELDEEASGLMLDFHLLNDGSTVVGNDNVTIWADEHLVHTLGAKGGSHELGNGSCGQNVSLF